MYESLQAEEIALRIAVVARHSELVREIREKLVRFRNTSTNAALPFLKRDQEIALLRVELLKQQGWTRENLFALKKSLLTS